MEKNEHSHTATEGYMGAYGLTCEPFGDVMSPAFFYPGATREQRLNLLLHLIPLGEILLITGVPGVGKTTLLNQFLSRASESWRVCHLDADTGIDSNQLLQQLMQAFAPEVQEQSDRGEQERLLIAQLQALRKHAQVPMLLIDNAHNISESALRTLSKFMTAESEESKPFGIVLFSEASIDEKLNNPALQFLRAQIKHTFELTLLNEAETFQYLDHRMRAAGLQDDGPFTAAVNSAIFGASNGLPLKVNERALAVLQNKSYTTPPTAAAADTDVTADSKPVKEKRRSLLRLWPFVAVAALASVLLFQNEINALFSPPAENSQATKQPPLEDATATPLELPADPQGSISREVPAVVESTEAEGMASQPDLEALPGNEVSSIDFSGSEVVVENHVDFMSEGVDEPVPDTAVEPIEQDEQSQSTAINQAGAPETVVEAVVEIEKEVAVKPAQLAEAEPAPQADIEQREWVMAQHPQAYTLQIVAQQQRQKREDFLVRFGLENEVKRFSTDKNGQRWYVAASGAYETRTEALEASRQLPEGIVPWARSFASIQKELWRSASIAEGVAAAAPSVVTPVAFSEQERWVLARPAEHYLLQLVAFEKAAKTSDFLASHALGSVAKQVRIMNKGQVWYVAIYGDAADRSAADEMVENLSQNKGISNPWVRSYGSLQAAMRALQPQ